MSKQPSGFLPRETFEIILENIPIPTFDLIIEVPDEGVLIARRKIAPYANQWALPGLRMQKGERRQDVFKRIALDEAGVTLDLDNTRIVGQFDGFFNTEHHRQDASTCYAVPAFVGEVALNAAHFTSHKFINEKDEIPSNMGAMYKYYLNLYFEG